MDDVSLQDRYRAFLKKALINLLAVRGAVGRVVVKEFHEANKKYTALKSSLDVLLSSRVLVGLLNEVTDESPSWIKLNWKEKMVRKLTSFGDEAESELIEQGCPQDELTDALIDGAITSTEAQEYAYSRLHSGIR